MTKRKFFTATAWLTGIVAAGLAIWVFAINTTAKNKAADLMAKEVSEEPVKQFAEQPEEKSEEQPAEAIKLTAVEEPPASFAELLRRGDKPKEEMELQVAEGEGAYLPKKEDGSRKTAALEISEEMIDEQVENIPTTIRLNSLAEIDGVPTNVVDSAKNHGYVDHTISSALEDAFDSKKDDDAGLDAEVAATAANPYWLSVMYRGIANLETYDEKIRDWFHSVNDFIVEDRKAFAANEEEFWELMKEDELLDNGYTIEKVYFGSRTPKDLVYSEIPGIGGDGVGHWVNFQSGKKASEAQLTENYRRYAAAWLAWLSTQSYEGVKSWQTVKKSAMYEWNRSIDDPAFARAEFTDKTNAQTDYPSLIFCARDKNNYRYTDFWGINYYTRDFELYGQGKTVTTKDGKKAIVYEDTDTTVAQIPSGSDKKILSYGYKKEKSSEPKPTSTPQPTPKPDPKKTNKKDSSKSSVNNPANNIDNKDPKGQGTDAFQLNIPVTNWGVTVAEAQYQPSAETLAILSGESTPGTEGPDLPPAGTSSPTETYTNTSGETVTEYSNYVESSGGVTYEDKFEVTDNEETSSRTEGETAETPEIPVQEDHDGDGNSSQNTGMPDFGFD